jgi:predicted nucleotidyltransferase
MSAPAVTPCTSRDDVLAVLREHYQALAAEFGLSSLQLFGSFATEQQTASSDVDLLASFTEPIGFGFIHLADRLEALLGRKVDLVAADGIKDNRRPFILSSLVDVVRTHPCQHARSGPSPLNWSHCKAWHGD